MEIEAKDEAQIKTLRQAVHFWENPEYSEQQAGVRKIYHYKAWGVGNIGSWAMKARMWSNTMRRMIYIAESKTTVKQTCACPENATAVYDIIRQNKI